jgi:hypothetical protein
MVGAQEKLARGRVDAVAADDWQVMMMVMSEMELMQSV